MSRLAKGTPVTVNGREGTVLNDHGDTVDVRIPWADPILAGRGFQVIGANRKHVHPAGETK
jgi:hypothetical protein